MTRREEASGHRCVAGLVPQAAIDAAVLAASKPIHDDGHTDCFYAGILLAAWPHLNAENSRLSKMARDRDDVIFGVARELRAALVVIERYEDEIHRLAIEAGR